MLTTHMDKIDGARNVACFCSSTCTLQRLINEKFSYEQAYTKMKSLLIWLLLACRYLYFK